jgi:cysteate synthase
MLAAHLGLKNLWIGFSGYWPLRDAYVNTGSFKEFEAYPTVVRLRERTSGVILVSSAGNTGRAFAQVSAETDQPVIIVVPVSARERIWTTLPAKNLLLITVDGDYTDAITLGNALCSIPGIYSEGGAKNVARRDGMGTVMLEGAVTIGKMPDWYIQGVGSGTGGIAAWEASIRLIKDGRFGSDLPRLLLIQNEPFIPMVRAWQAGRREIIPDLDMPDAKGAISQVYSDVLTNRAPPYAIPGGVYDALSETGGLMDSVSSEAAREAGALFHRLEGIDPDPAAAVCVAGFIKAVHNQVIDPKATILLSITGGGYEIINQDMRIVHPPDIKVENVLNEQCTNSIKRQVTTWVSQYV